TGACGAALAQSPAQTGLGSDHVQLPSGPGSLNGFGPDYDKDLPNGAVSLSIPIKVPSGIAGFNPNLSINYDSGDGSGPFGFGFDRDLALGERRAYLPFCRYVDDDNGIDDDFDGIVDEEDERDLIRAYDGGWPINLVSEDDLDPEDDLEPQGTGYFFT